jgi:hypothetical protein
MIDRREFIAGTAVITVAPTLVLSRTQFPPVETATKPVAFMIEGWSVQDDSGTAEQVWIRVGHSWRTAWR